MKKILFFAPLFAFILLAGCNLNPLQNQNDQSSSSSEQLTAENVYKNDQYGFELTFPDTWQDYQVTNRTPNSGSLGNVDSLDFGFPEQASIFNISMFQKDQWEKIEDEEGPTPTYLGENSNYVFAYATSQDTVNDTMAERLREVDSIINTFNITNITK